LRRNYFTRSLFVSVFFLLFCAKIFKQLNGLDVNLLTRAALNLAKKNMKEYGWSRLSAGCVYSNDRSHAEHVWSNSCQLLFKVPLRNETPIFICWPSLMAHNDMSRNGYLDTDFPSNNSPIRFYFFSFFSFG
jgi:hypothetical protein